MTEPRVRRIGDSDGLDTEFVAEIAPTRADGGYQLVTAIRTGAGKLKLIAWGVNDDGLITRLADSGNQAGEASWIAVAKDRVLSPYVTACRAGNGHLKLISWGFTQQPWGLSIDRLFDSGDQESDVTNICLSALKTNRILAAFRTNGVLRLTLWHVDDFGSFRRLADSRDQPRDEVSEVSLVNTDTDRVLTGVRDTDGNLSLISWLVTDTQISRLRDSHGQAGSSRLIRLALDTFNHPVAAVQAGNDHLKLIVWSVGDEGQFVRRADSDDLAKLIKGNDLTAAQRGLLASAVLTSAGRLKVILWSTNADGGISRFGDSDDLAGIASLPTVMQLRPDSADPAPLVTCVRTQLGVLKLIAWAY